ncbi:MAG: hypothetical protein WA628_15040, partial [Terriglobales bacterium]
MVSGKFKTGMVATASLLLALTLSLPAQGQRPKHDQPSAQHQSTPRQSTPRQSAPRREAARPPRQERSVTREGALPSGPYRGGAQSRRVYPQSSTQERFGGYPQGPSRQVARPPSAGRSESSVSSY